MRPKEKKQITKGAQTIKDIGEQNLAKKSYETNRRKYVKKIFIFLR